MAELDGALRIPTVTEADLRAFHTAHFSPAATASFTSAFLSLPVQAREVTFGEETEENDDDDDGLGYYFDGVKRTLTDEQVAMFRHSEVHALIRERGARRDQSNGRGDTDMVDARTEEGEDEREEMEYAAFLVRERQELSMQGQVGEVDYGREEESSRGAHRKDAKTPDWQRQRRKQVSYADIDEGEINPDGGGDIPDSKGADGGNAKTFAWPRIGG